MNMQVYYIISPIAALLLTYILIPVFRKMAFRIQLVDNPNHRKVHQSSVPLVGGISIFISTTLSLWLVLPFELEVFNFKNVFMAAFILLLVGVIDDRFDLRASLKLGIQLILAHCVFEQGIRIESLYGLMGVFELSYWAQFILTIVVITGVVNAFNLMDGIDGLAAGIGLVSFMVFSVLSMITGQTAMALMFLTLIGSLLAFLRFNLSKNHKIFMGDAGSIVLGFILVVSSIRLLQSAHNSEYPSWVIFGVISVLFVPVMDALRVFRGRAKSGKSPFNADKTHLHHLVLSVGLQHNTTTIIILSIMAFIMAIGYFVFNLLGLTYSIVLMLFVFYFVTNALQFNNKLKHWKQRILVMENKW